MTEEQETAAATRTKLTPEQQSAVLEWVTKAKIPIISCRTYPKKEVHIKNWSKIDFRQVDFNEKLAAGESDNGIALVLGKTLSGSYYSIALDFDGWDAVMEWFGSWEQVLSSSQKTRIEWHGDKERIHYIFLAKRPIANRKLNIKGSKLEVRCENQLLFSSPSIHEDGESTFPKLVDEMDFTDNKMLINNVKCAIDQPRLRKVLDTSRRAEYIPALSAFVMTSNPPPPLNDAAFMKRVAARYFPATETHFKDQQSARNFDTLLQHLDKLHARGQFRNKFIMDNQQLILDKKLAPFEKAKKIVIAAYESAGMLVPCWLMTKQLEQKHLEESIEDYGVIVKRAFESYIDTNFRNALNFWQKSEAPEHKALTLPKEVSLRLVKLVDSHLLADIKRAKNEKIIIHRGILVELYKYGVTNDQLPNLKALADYIGGTYKKSNGNKVVICTPVQLAEYLDKIEEVVG